MGARFCPPSQRSPSPTASRVHLTVSVSTSNALINHMDTLIHKAIPVPTPDGRAMVAVIYFQPHRQQWATDQPGKSTWKSVRPSNILAVVDLALHYGQLYANTRFRVVYVFLELHGLGSASPKSSCP